MVYDTIESMFSDVKPGGMHHILMRHADEVVRILAEMKKK